ncbi:hypothetical protein OBBRIDRAFT_803523 [Obba rivulosa]|uniref:F-box domain-containing protein n=1 Tax=Obba rivulosa TaxID=1052685 RepID=A0A8E2AUC4_9APHY|nr:hypothetical protein OBBRIDRAFT_803523 [Obba rivulosa]
MFRRGFLISSKLSSAPTRIHTQPFVEPPEPEVTTPNLPPELTDRIIDHLEGDKRALANCGLVCRSWLPRSRFYSFRRIVLRTTNSKTFIQLLNDDPELGLYTTHLVIGTSRTDDTDWHVDVLPKVISYMPNVTTLELAGRAAYEAEHFKDFKSVTSLKLRACEFAALKDATSLLCAFPRLEALVIESTLIVRGEQDPSLTEMYRPPLKDIIVVSSALNPEPFVNWLISGGVHEGFQSLTLLPIQKPALFPVGKFLSAAGPSLKHFEIALLEDGPDSFNDIFGKHFSLSHCTALRSLAFASPFEYAMAFQTGHASFSWIASMISQVSSRDLEEISFTVYAPDTAKFSSPEFGQVVRLLQSDQFKDVQRVRFLARCLEGSDGSNMEKRVRDVFPHLDKQGKLQIDTEVIHV